MNDKELEREEEWRNEAPGVPAHPNWIHKGEVPVQPNGEARASGRRRNRIKGQLEYVDENLSFRNVDDNVQTKAANYYNGTGPGGPQEEERGTYLDVPLMPQWNPRAPEICQFYIGHRSTTVPGPLAVSQHDRYIMSYHIALMLLSYTHPGIGPFLDELLALPGADPQGNIIGLKKAIIPLIAVYGTHTGRRKIYRDMGVDLSTRSRVERAEMSTTDIGDDGLAACVVQALYHNADKGMTKGEVDESALLNGSVAENGRDFVMNVISKIIDDVPALVRMPKFSAELKGMMFMDQTESWSNTMWLAIQPVKMTGMLVTLLGSERPDERSTRSARTGPPDAVARGDVSDEIFDFLDDFWGLAFEDEGEIHLAEHINRAWTGKASGLKLSMEAAVRAKDNSKHVVGPIILAGGHTLLNQMLREIIPPMIGGALPERFPPVRSRNIEEVVRFWRTATSNGIRREGDRQTRRIEVMSFAVFFLDTVANYWYKKGLKKFHDNSQRFGMAPTLPGPVAGKKWGSVFSTHRPLMESANTMMSVNLTLDYPEWDRGIVTAILAKARRSFVEKLRSSIGSYPTLLTYISNNELLDLLDTFPEIWEKGGLMNEWPTGLTDTFFTHEGWFFSMSGPEFQISSQNTGVAITSTSNTLFGTKYMDLITRAINEITARRGGSVMGDDGQMEFDAPTPENAIEAGKALARGLTDVIDTTGHKPIDDAVYGFCTWYLSKLTRHGTLYRKMPKMLNKENFGVEITPSETIDQLGANADNMSSLVSSIGLGHVLAALAAVIEVHGMPQRKRDCKNHRSRDTKDSGDRIAVIPRAAVLRLSLGGNHAPGIAALCNSLVSHGLLMLPEQAQDGWTGGDEFRILRDYFCFTYPEALQPIGERSGVRVPTALPVVRPDYTEASIVEGGPMVIEGPGVFRDQPIILGGWDDYVAASRLSLNPQRLEAAEDSGVQNPPYHNLTKTYATAKLLESSSHSRDTRRTNFDPTNIATLPLPHAGVIDVGLFRSSQYITDPLVSGGVTHEQGVHSNLARVLERTYGLSPGGHFSSVTAEDWESPRIRELHIPRHTMKRWATSPIGDVTAEMMSYGVLRADIESVRQHYLMFAPLELSREGIHFTSGPADDTHLIKELPTHRVDQFHDDLQAALIGGLVALLSDTPVSHSYNVGPG